MITRRVRHDAGGALVGGELQQAIQRAADLEAAGMLQALGLEQHARTDAIVDGLGLEHRRLDQPPAQPHVSIDDVGNVWAERCS